MQAVIDSIRKFTRRQEDQRGAALILTIVVILVLSTIGIAMVGFTETEENTSAGHRDQMQAQTIAEAGARVALQMFRTPGDRRLVPLYAPQAAAGAGYDYFGTTQAAIDTSLNAIGIYRENRPPAGTIRYSGNNNRLFMQPYDTTWDRTFGGVYTDATNDLFDLSFRRKAPGSTAVIANNWLDTNINTMFRTATPGSQEWNETVGRITEISFYAPPVVGVQAFAYATVRVTAEKFETVGGVERVIARETIEAIVGDETTRPAILTNGDLEIQSSSAACGSECEQIHANGNITLNSSSQYSGGNPMMTAQGTVSPAGPPPGGGMVNPPALPASDPIPPPMINPWDLLYRPTGALLDRYYLVTNREVDPAWRDNDPATDTANYTNCTTGGGVCQDYGLEFAAGGGAAVARGTQSRLYKWDEALRKWNLQHGPINSGNSHPFGTARLAFNNAADTTPNGAADDARVPFNKNKVPGAWWDVIDINIPAAGAAHQGVVILVDGNLNISSSAGGDRTGGNPAWRASLITVGGFRLGSSSNIDPALDSRVTIIAGRDIQIMSSFNGNLGSGAVGSFCPTTTPQTAPSSAQHLAASGVMAAHEQFYVDSSSHLLGIIIAESKINLHNNVTTGFLVYNLGVPGGSKPAGNEMYIESSSKHGYLCDQPPWPFPTQGVATILSMTSAGR